MCLQLSLWALRPTHAPNPHLLDHDPQSLGKKAVLKLVLPRQPSWCGLHDELAPVLSIHLRFHYFDGFFHLSSPSEMTGC